jgi:hypothetical protein
MEYKRHGPGSTFINDSKATNYDAAVVGLGSESTRHLLITWGGKTLRKGTIGEWLGIIKAQNCCCFAIWSRVQLCGSVGIRYEATKLMAQKSVSFAPQSFTCSFQLQ